MKTATFTVIAALLAACSPPPAAEREPAPTPAPAIVCNALTPDLAKQVSVLAEAPAASAAADLRGGRIAPGIYDLASAARIGAASGWSGTRAVALEIAEREDGAVMFNWAGAAEGRALDTWTATFAEMPSPRLSYTCGRMGDVALTFATAADALELRLQDGAGGQLALSFQRRP